MNAKNLIGRMVLREKPIENKFTTAFAIIFMVVFWIAVGWAVVSQLM